MFNFKKLNVLVAVFILFTTLMPAKKAEAGIIIGSPVVAVLAVLPFVTGTMTLAQGSDLFKNNDAWGWTLLGIGIAVVVLDNNTTTDKNLNSIPPYMLQEIQDQASLKAHKMEAGENGIKEVIFSHAEVDEIFDLADENTSPAQLEILRQALTTKVI